MQIQCSFISGGCNSVYNAIDYCQQPNYQSLIAYPCANQVIIYDTQKLKVTCSLSAFEKRVNCVKFYTVGEILNLVAISGGIFELKIIKDGIISSWSLQNGLWQQIQTKIISDMPLQQVKPIFKNFDIITADIHDSENKLFFIVLGIDGKLRVLDDEFNEVSVLDFGQNTMESVDAIQYAGTVLFALSGQDKGVHLYELSQNELIFKCTLRGHLRSVNAVSFQVIQGYLLLASGGKDNYVRIWKIREVSIKDQDVDVENKQGFKNISLSNNKKYVAKLESVLQGHIEEVSSLWWSTQSQDNELDLTLLSSSFDYSIILWKQDQQSGVWCIASRLGQTSGNKNQFFGVRTNKDGNRVIAHTFDGGVFFWSKSDIENQWIESAIVSGHYSYVTDLDVSPNGYIVSCSQDQTTRIWAKWLNNESWHEVSRPQVHGYDMNTVRFLDNQPNQMDLIVSGGDEKIIRLFKPTPMATNFINALSNAQVNLRQPTEYIEEIIEIMGQKTPIRLFKVGSEGISQPLGLMNKQMEDFESESIPELQTHTKLVTVDLPHQIQYDQPPTHSMLSARGLWPELNKLYGHGYEVVRVATHGKIIASSCRSTSEEAAQIIIWNSENFKIIGYLRAHTFSVVDLQFSSSGLYLVSASKDRTVGLFKKLSDTYQLICRTQPASRIIYTCCIDPNEKFIVSGSRDKKVRVHLTDQNLTKVMEKNMGAPVTASALATLGQENVLVLGFENGSIELHRLCLIDYTIQKLSEVQPQYKHNMQVNRIKILKQRNRQVEFATCSDDHTIRIFSVDVDE